jgi:hypothetical protein
MKNNFKIIFYALILSSLSILSSCKEDLVNNGFASSDKLDASFTVTSVSSSPNKFVLTSSNENYILSQWDLDDGGGYARGNNKDTVFLPDAGTYSVKHKVMGAGGVFSDVATQTITVATSDLNSGNLILGNKFASAADIAEWTILDPAGTVPVTFSNGKCLIKSAGGWDSNGVFQAISVVKGKEYKVDMVCSSTSGCSETWFEVYCGYSNPAGNTGYSEGGTLVTINTWNGSGTTAFSGKISAIGTATDLKGIFTATQTGTVYLVIRAGGNGMGDGIAFTNVEFRGISE